MLKSLQKQLTDAGIDPKFFNFVAQMAHFWTMYGLVKTVGDLGHRFHHQVASLIAAFACCAGYAAWHEFYWDPRHENPATRGSDWEDFLFLIGGGLVGAAMSFVLLIGT